ncbi:anoctamin-7 [Pelodytes ibericus]
MAPIELREGEISLYSDHSPTTLRTRRALKPLTTALRDANIAYTWTCRLLYRCGGTMRSTFSDTRRTYPHFLYCKMIKPSRQGKRDHLSSSFSSPEGLLKILSTPPYLRLRIYMRPHELNKVNMMKKKDHEEERNVLLHHQEGSETYGTQTWSTSHGPQDDDILNFFSDGRTQIDYVLVWETQRNMVIERLEEKRQTFFDCLKQHGLNMEEHTSRKNDLTVHFMLLNAPWGVLCYYAEDMSLRAPLKACSDQAGYWVPEDISKTVGFFNESTPRHPPETFNCHFKSRKLMSYLGNENKDTFFTNTQRHQILFEILANAQYGSSGRGEVGVERLLCEDVFSAAYPLHDGDYTPEPSASPEQFTHRQILYKYWARWIKWCKHQPLDHIRKYYGEKIALYFAWLGFYTKWLLPAAVIGTLAFAYGFYIATYDIPTADVCHSEDQYVMCPACTICPNWNLSSICQLYKAAVLFDHPGTLLFSFFMSVWSVTFLEYWKRLSATLSYRWDCLEFSEIEEPARPEFTALAPLTILNPITGIEEPYFPKAYRLRRIFTGSMVIVLMIAVVIIFLISVILYRIIIFVVLSKSEKLYTSASLIASMSGSVLNLIITLILSKVYTALAHFLTHWEMHRTHTAYEDAFTFKVFIFEFVNYYSTPIYIAFFKGRFVGFPGHEITILRIHNESCNPGGCLIELAQQMLIIMVGKQILNNIKEFIFPKLVLCWHKLKYSKNQTQEKESPWQRDYKLVSYKGLFEEYLEMVIQFGFITIFVAACPLAPLFALLNNWIEIRLDAQKFVCEYRRPLAERAQGIGIWMSILEAITSLAVIGNAFLVAFTSDYLPRIYYQYKTSGNLTGYIDFSLAHAPSDYVRNHSPCRYQALRDSEGNLTFDFWVLMAIRLAFIILFEHVVFFLGRLIDLLVPDVPEAVEIKVKRERFLAKQALAENQYLTWATEKASVRKRITPRTTGKHSPRVCNTSTGSELDEETVCNYTITPTCP